MGESNWAGNHGYAAETVLAPRTVDEVRAAVAGAATVKALGSRHCFNDIADAPGGLLLDLAALETPVEINAEAATATVGGSARYGDFVGQLHEAGFALPNLASLPHITVAGSVATGTHGSGRRRQGLASAVSALELVTADGELRTFSWERDPDVFPGLVVNLGALGVVTRLTLDLVPAFEVRQNVFEGLPWAALPEHFDEIEDAGYSVSLFTDWTGDKIGAAWVKSRVEPGVPAPSELHGAIPADGPGTRCPRPVSRSATPRRSSACRDRGTSGSRISRSRSPRVSATSCSRSTSCRTATRWPRSRRCAGSPTGWPRCCWCPRSARSPPTSCG